MTFDRKAWQKVYNKAYFQRSENIAYMKAYSQRPENKARAKARYEKLKKLQPATPFYKQYGMTMAGMGRIVGVGREAIRQRYKRGIDVTKIGKQKSWSFTYASSNDSAKRISIRSR